MVLPGRSVVTLCRETRSIPFDGFQSLAGGLRAQHPEEGWRGSAGRLPRRTSHFWPKISASGHEELSLF